MGIKFKDVIETREKFRRAVCEYYGLNYDEWVKIEEKGYKIEKGQRHVYKDMMREEIENGERKIN